MKNKLYESLKLIFEAKDVVFFQGNTLLQRQ